MSGHPLDDVVQFVARFVVLPSEHAAVAVTLWVAHAHTMEAAEVTPFLSVQSAEKRSGKTRLLEVLELLAPRTLRTAGISEAALFRSTSEDPPPTLMIDEVDTIFTQGAKTPEKESLRGLLNAGHRRGSVVVRCVVEGKNPRVERYEVFCPKVIAGIGEPPDTIGDRSIAIRMKRRRKDEQVERFRWRRVQSEAWEVASRIAEWCQSVTDQAAAADPVMPDELDDRAQDGWEPLFALADLAGGDWPDRARAAAVALASERTDSDGDSLGVRLLGDIRTVFTDAGVDRFPSAQLAHRLCEMETAPWGDLRGRSLDSRGLARRLDRYGVKPKVIRLPDGGTPRGYLLSEFQDAFARYLAPPERNNRNNAMDKPIQTDPRAQQAHTVLHSENGRKPHGQGAVAPVALESDLERWERLAGGEE